MLPRHLAVWPDGVVEGSHSPLIDDDRLGPEFSLDEWCTEIRHGFPAAVVAATYDGLGAGASTPGRWLDQTRRAAMVQRDGEPTAFTGDTTPTSLVALRSWVGRRMEERARSVEDATLVVSELSTNVERHARGWLTVDLVDVDDEVLLAVTDPATASLPAPRRAGPREVSGRGLLVVASMSANWGVVVRDGSKTVWSALAPQPS